MSKTSTKPGPAILLFALSTVCLVAIMIGCDKFKGEQTVPSYLQVDSLGFASEYATQGTDNQKFVDVWIYVDDDLIGGFEMPATIPVLSVGLHKLELRPGIKLNGIADTRSPYPCVTPIILDQIEFLPDSVIEVSGTSEYWDNAAYIWMEDFEDASLSIHPTTASDTSIFRTTPAGNPSAYIDEYSQYSGIAYVDNDHDFLELVSDDGNGQGFVFDRGDFIFLELHYKMDVPLVIGAYIKKMDNTIEDRSFLVVNETDTWNKIYVNFTPMVNETTDAENFKIYLQAHLETTSGSAVVMLDNIKLVTRPNL